MKDNQHEQLFSELTPAEAAVVEGGIRVTIERIKAIKARSDWFGPDDTYITVNNTRLWGAYSMKTGQIRDVNRSYTGPGSSAQVRLFDADPGHDDAVGEFTAVNTNGALRRIPVGGARSEYEVYYRASA